MSFQKHNSTLAIQAPDENGPFYIAFKKNKPKNEIYRKIIAVNEYELAIDCEMCDQKNNNNQFSKNRVT